MERKYERLAKRAKKAGIRASMKEGHALTESELRKVKVQVMPAFVRVGLFLFGAFLGLASVYCFANESPALGLLLFLASLLFMLLGVLGVRKTVEQIVSEMDVSLAGKFIGVIAEGIASAALGLFDAD